MRVPMAVPLWRSQAPSDMIALPIIDLSRCQETYKADLADPVHLDAMEMANNLSSWLKRYLWRFTGMGPANLQSYLNWFVYLFRVRQAEDRWPKTTRAVRNLRQPTFNLLVSNNLVECTHLLTSLITCNGRLRRLPESRRSIQRTSVLISAPTTALQNGSWQVAIASAHLKHEIDFVECANLLSFLRVDQETQGLREFHDGFYSKEYYPNGIWSKPQREGNRLNRAIWRHRFVVHVRNIPQTTRSLKRTIRDM